MIRFAERAASVSGWRRYSLAFGLGGVATLGLPPLFLFPVNFIVFPILLWMLGGAMRRRATFAVGWWFGFGYFTVGLYWIGNAMLVFADKFAWLLPFASAGLPAGLALFSGATALAARFGRSHLERALLFAIAWAAAEWLRGHILTGFPWNLIGYAWTGSDAMLQSTAVFGIYGLSLLVVVSACLPAALADSAHRRWVVTVTLALPLAVWAGGAIRLAQAPATRFVEGVGLRIVQSDIPQREKWARPHQERNLKRFLDLSLRDRPDWITHIIWPETAATFFVADNPGLRRTLAAAVPRDGLLVTGAPRRDHKAGRIMNAMVAIDDAGAVVGVYDKFHLVPFGEYMPFADILPLPKITQGKTGFSPGPGPRTVWLPGLPPVSPLICYEVIFPGNVVARADRPGWLLNLTNDAWYGLSAGPYQHLAHARVRAAEEGLPMVRAAYTGISAVVDPYGRVLQTLGLNTAGVIDAKLPRPLTAPTIFAELGNLTHGILFGFVCLIAMALRQRTHRKIA